MASVVNVFTFPSMETCDMQPGLRHTDFKCFTWLAALARHVVSKKRECECVCVCVESVIVKQL